MNIFSWFLVDVLHIQAILNGCWVVFEDLDKAPNDVKSIILPLLEGSGSFVTGHGEVDIVFRI